MHAFRTAAIALIWHLAPLLSAAAPGEAPPNLVVIIADDLGSGELSCQNPATDIPTPHLDALAAAGVRFTQGYVTAPFCAASRAGLLTGRYQTRFGFEFNPIGARNDEPGIGLPAGERTVADRLRDEAGYATALIGKWHLGGTAPFHPMRRGFDEFFGFLHEGHSFVPPPHAGVTTWLRRKRLPGGGEGRWTSADGRLILSTHLGTNEPDYDANNPVLRGSQPVDERSNLTVAFTREAVSFIERHGERPFFLCLSYNAVHSPMQADEAYLERFHGIGDVHRRLFAAMLAQLDDGVGTVMAALDRQGLAGRTLVWFLSDNGGPTRELTSRNAPLRGEKGSLLEGGIRVPFLLRWPGVAPAGSVYERPVISLDIAATALAAAGLGTGPEAALDGVDLLPYLRGETPGDPHEALFWRVGTQAAWRSGDWKLVRTGRRGEPADWELFDLARDPGESGDRSGAEPEIRRRLIGEWERRNREMIEPLWR